jgi:type IV pilus assembly protein PilF
MKLQIRGRYNLLLRKMKTIISVLITFSILLAGCAENKVVVNKEKARALEDMGISLVRQGKLRAGLEQLLKAVKMDPENPDLHHGIALVYRDLGEYQLSLQHFKKALELKPQFSEAQNNLGTLYLLVKKWDLAIACFQNAVKDILYKTPQFAYNNMGYAYYNKGEYEKAIQYYNMALQSSPSFASCYTNLAIACEAIKRWEEAIEAYKKSIQYAPENPVPHFRLGRLYYELNRRDEAKKTLTTFLSLSPEGPEADEAKALLEKIKSK